MLGVFMLVDFATNKGVVTVPTTIPTVVGGLPLDAKPGAALQYCLQSEEVPRNIDSAFIVPEETVPRPGANTPDLGAGEYDCYEPMATTGASSGALIKFFDTQLEARGWSLFSKGASNGDPNHCSKRRQRRLLLGARRDRQQVHRIARRLDLHDLPKLRHRLSGRDQFLRRHRSIFRDRRPQPQVQRIDYVSHSGRGRHADQP